MDTRSSADDLKIMALLALFELVEAAQAEPMPRSRWLRFLLAFLFSRSKGVRTSFDDFWKAATTPDLFASWGMCCLHRQMELDCQFARICVETGEHPEKIRDRYRAVLIARSRREGAHTAPPPDQAA